MAKMPELVQLRETYAPKDLVVIGINFDDDVEKARSAVAETKQTWPQVHAKSAAKGRESLWEEISDVRSLPRLLLIDPQGVLRDDLRPDELKAKLEERLGKR